MITIAFIGFHPATVSARGNGDTEAILGHSSGAREDVTPGADRFHRSRSGDPEGKGTKAGGDPEVIAILTGML